MMRSMLALRPDPELKPELVLNELEPEPDGEPDLSLA